MIEVPRQKQKKANYTNQCSTNKKMIFDLFFSIL